MLVLNLLTYLLTYLILLSDRHHGTTEYRGTFSRYVPWRKIVGTAPNTTIFTNNNAIVTNDVTTIDINHIYHDSKFRKLSFFLGK